MTDDEYCYFHSVKPEIVKKRQEASARGGKKGKLSPRNDNIESIEDVKHILAETVNELRASPTNNVVSRARAVGYLCSILLVALEKGDMEERIAKLESLLEAEDVT